MHLFVFYAPSFESVFMAMDGSTTASFTPTEIRSVIKFFTFEGMSTRDAHDRLFTVVGDSAPSYETTRRWMREFENGRVSTEDLDRSGRPPSATLDDFVGKVQDLLQEDSRMTCSRMASYIGISKNSVHRILREKLEKRKIVAKWVPHVLTEDQRKTRRDISAEHLRRFQSEGKPFLQRIVACDETWAYAFEPELKRQSSEWHSPGSPRPTKALRSRAALKVMHITFFDCRGIVFDFPVPSQTTVNGELYLDVLRNHVKPAIRKKRPDLAKGGVILLQDNAAPHRHHKVKEALQKWGWETLAHPPYSPDLSPCDFFLFPRIKEHLRGERFSDAEAINSAYASRLRDLAKSGVEDGIFGLVHRWEKCVERNGDYVE